MVKFGSQANLGYKIYSLCQSPCFKNLEVLFDLGEILHVHKNVSVHLEFQFSHSRNTYNY